MSSRRKRKASNSSSEGSPAKKQRRLAEGLLEDPSKYHTEFQPGQIVRIKLKNWVTFDYTAIECEPGLNLICGPNGTGKSSIVCAICLGLGGKPRSLGRGDKPTDFIKYGRTEAIIEMDLFKAKGQTDSIKRIISKNGKSSSWFLNDHSVKTKDIERFVKTKRNIKVDNLCQFLAQDRVSEFARLSPKELLIETEKAIEDDQLYKWHQFLMDAGDEAANAHTQIENARQTLRQNENEIETLKRTIEQFELKKKMEGEMKVYQALLEWRRSDLKHQEYKAKLKETEKLQKQYEKKKGNVGPLKKEESKWKKKVVATSTKLRDAASDGKKWDRRRTKAKAKLIECSEEIKAKEDEIKQANQDLKARIKQKRVIESSIEKLQQKVGTFDLEEIERAKAEKTQLTRGALKAARQERNRLDDEYKSVNNQKQEVQCRLERIDRQLAQWRNEKARKEGLIFNSHRSKERQFKLWVDTHRHEFVGEVYGPIVQEMTVKEQQFADFLNSVISATTLYGYVCTNGDDWERVVRHAGDMKLTIAVYTSTADDSNSNNNNNRNNHNNSQQQEYIRRPMEHSELNRHGVDGYLDEIYEAPAVIKRVLNDNLGLHQRGYCMREISSSALDSVLATVSGQQHRLRSLLTPTAVYSIKDSRYSSNVLRSLNNLVRHRNPILTVTPDFSQQIECEQEKKKALNHEMEALLHQKREIEQQKKQNVAEMEKINDRKKAVEQTIAAYNKVSNQLAKKKRDLEELEKENRSDDPQQLGQELTAQIEEQNAVRIDIFAKMAAQFDEIVDSLRQVTVYQILKKQYEEEQKHIKQKLEAMNRRNQELKQELEKSKREQSSLKDQYQALTNKANQEYPRRQYATKWTADDKKLELDEIENKINHLQGRINVLFIDESRVQRYQRLNKTIAKQRADLEKQEAEQNRKVDDIKKVENQWKPQLEEAVDKISGKFSEFFQQFNNAEGRVRLVSHSEDSKEANEAHTELAYSEWCIQIETKFRREQPWKQLTSSSQSGGEKSVSTMLYLLSLKQVTTVPFRVVDEINQGMDPQNERRIMHILNYECTPRLQHVNKNGSGGDHAHSIVDLPQYFVVTPKLLPRLQYSPCSSVYVIFNGPFQMPQNFWKLTEFVDTQKQLTQQSTQQPSQSQSQSQSQDEEEEESD